VRTIEVNNLTKYYGKARGIVDVSFNVEERPRFSARMLSSMAQNFDRILAISRLRFSTTTR